MTYPLVRVQTISSYDASSDEELVKKEIDDLKKLTRTKEVLFEGDQATCESETIDEQQVWMKVEYPCRKCQHDMYDHISESGEKVNCKGEIDGAPCDCKMFMPDTAKSL